MTIDLFSDHNERLRVDLNAAELLRDAEQPEPRLNRRKLKLLNRSLLSFALLDVVFVEVSLGEEFVDALQKQFLFLSFSEIHTYLLSYVPQLLNAWQTHTHTPAQSLYQVLHLFQRLPQKPFSPSFARYYGYTFPPFASRTALYDSCCSGQKL